MIPQLSIVVSWRDRKELELALPSLVECARHSSGEVIVVNYSGAVEALRRQTESLRDFVRVVHIQGERYFNKSAAQNIGASVARGEMLFFCDCDIIVEKQTVVDMCRRLAEFPGHFGTLAGVQETERNARRARHIVSFGYTLRLTVADGRTLEIVDNEEDARDGTRQAPGLLFVKRHNFLRVNGYNARLHGWGWEDQDMISRLTLGAGLVRISEGNALHISHDDNARVAHYPLENRWQSRDQMFRTALANYDAANFKGTYLEDLARLQRRISETRPFQAGLIT